MGDIQNVSKRKKRKASQSSNVLEQQEGKASRSLTPVPPELGKLLKLVNIVPPDVELPDIAEMLKGVSPLFEEARLLGLIGQICKGLPDLVTIYVWLGEERLIQILDGAVSDEIDGITDDARDMLEKYISLEKEDEPDSVGMSAKTRGYLAGVQYTYLRESREMLRDIARHVKSYPYYIKELPKTRLYPSGGLIIVGKDGHLKHSPPRFIKAIEGVEAARIRECEVCRLLFWAGRLDQKTCTTKCAKVLRTRRWREKYQENYKLKRSGKKPLTAKEKKRLAEKRHGIQKG